MATNMMASIGLVGGLRHSQEMPTNGDSSNNISDDTKQISILVERGFHVDRQLHELQDIVVNLNRSFKEQAEQVYALKVEREHDKVYQAQEFDTLQSRLEALYIQMNIKAGSDKLSSTINPEVKPESMQRLEDQVNKIQNRLDNLHTEHVSSGTTLERLDDSMEKMHQAIKEQHEHFSSMHDKMQERLEKAESQFEQDGRNKQVFSGDCEETVVELQHEAEDCKHNSCDEGIALPPSETVYDLATGGSVIQHPKSRAFCKVQSVSIAELSIDDEHLDMLQPTVWETVLFAGLPQLTLTGTSLLLICLAFNIALQGLFTYIIATKFAASRIDLDSVREWRHVIGHHVSQIDFGGFSLVSRVCDSHPTLSVATSQAKLLHDIRNYSSSNFDGPALCMAVITIWFVMWLQEAERIHVFMKEMWLVPRSARTHIRIAPDGSWALHSLPMSRKVFMIFVTLLRLGVSLSLLIQGTRWLVCTTSITELVLNGAALAFVFDIDELLHDTAVPKRVKLLEENLKINMYAAGSGMYALRGIVHLSSASVFALVMFLAVVRPNAAHMRDVIDAFCGGERAFVVGHQADLNIHFHAKTRKYGSTSADIWRTVDDLIRGSSDVSSALLPDVQVMESLLQLKASEVADQIMLQCEDSTFSDLPMYWQKMLDDLHAPTAASCKELSWACGSASVHLVRMLCPATCKCHHSQPSTGFAKGCPTSVCRYRAYFDTAVNCTDPTAPSLTANPHWRSYWESLSFRNGSNVIGSKAEIADFALTFGCSVIMEYQLHEELCTASEQFLLTYHSLDSWCPEACECHSKNVWSCPQKCLSLNSFAG